MSAGQGPDKSAVRRRIAALEQSRALRGPVRPFVESQLFQQQLEVGRNPLPASNAQHFSQLVRDFGCSDQTTFLRELTDDLPAEMPSRLRRHPTRIGIWPPEARVASVHGLAHVEPLTLENWREQIGDLDLVLIVPPAFGAVSAAPDDVTRTLLRSARKLGVRTALLPRPDAEIPPTWLTITDLVLAPDKTACRALKTEKQTQTTVRLFPQGANPTIHHPVGSRRRRLRRAMFAGSWFAHRFEERRAPGRRILEGLALSNWDFVIVDDLSVSGQTEHVFPQFVIPHLAPALPEDLLLKAQRITDVSLVLGAASGLPAGVAALLGAGSHVLANYNPTTNEALPNVFIADSPEDVRAHLETMTPDELYRRQLDGLRVAHSQFSAHRHLGDLLADLGLPHAPSSFRVALTGDLDTCRSVQASQSIVLDYLSPEETASGVRGDVDIIIPVTSDVRLGHRAAEDLINAFRFTDVEFVSKTPPHSEPGAAHEHDFTTSGLPGATAFWNGSEAWHHWLATGAATGRGYAIDSLNIRVGDDGVELSEPVWEDAATAVPDPASSAQLSVVVPVYNNGALLRAKCFASLRRSSLFDAMEILLVDDGSEDQETVEVLEWLARIFSPRAGRPGPAVRWLRNPPGGSGSASRPRNQGLAAASAPTITYLDPDNEAINDGYALLSELLRESQGDFAIGDMSRRDRFITHVNNASSLQAHIPHDESAPDGPRGARVLMPDRDSLTELSFVPMSIQALVANTRWLRDLGLEQPVGAVGQDSFFFQQMLFHASRIVAVPVAIHIYYAAVSKSTVNTVNPRFFAKYLPMERARSTWLREVGLLEAYVERRFENFLRVWHLPKLRQVPAEEYQEAIGPLKEINEMYGITAWRHPECAEVFGGPLVASPAEEL